MSLDKYSAGGRIAARIEESVRSGRVFHAYIIEADTTVDREEFAREFCKAVLCPVMPGKGCGGCISCRKVDSGNYEDLYYVRPEGSTVKDEQISRLQANLRKKPIGDRNIAVIFGADAMTPRAQNRLLKTIEEPFPGTIIMLICENRNNLLETIRSRCVFYRLESVSQSLSDNEAAESFTEALERNAGFFEIKALMSRYIKNRDDALYLLDGMEKFYGEAMRQAAEQNPPLMEQAAGPIRAIRLIEEARRDLQFKVNYQYALKNLFLKIGG